MLRAAFRNRISKGPDNHCDQGHGNSSESEDEFYDFKMEFCRDSELQEGKVHIIDKPDGKSYFGAQDLNKFSEECNSNSLSKSEIKTSNENSSAVTSKFDHTSLKKSDVEKSFSHAEREIYEMQLVQLQEQLVATMISEQEKDQQLKKYQDMDIEKLAKGLKEEQEKNAELTEKLRIMKNKAQNSKLSRANANKSDPRKKSNQNFKNLEDDFNQGEEWIDVSSELNAESNAQMQDKSDEPDVPSSPCGSSAQLHWEHGTEQTIPELGHAHSAKNKRDGTHKLTKSRYSDIQNFKKKIIEMIVERLWDFVNEEPESTLEDNEDEDGLSVKKLKENINRFSNGIKPITNFIKTLYNLKSWSNIAATGLTFMVYMYAALHGYLFSLLLLIIIWKFIKNYLSARGITAQFGLKTIEKDQANDDKSLSDKFQLVLEVAKKVQNMLGKMANSLEKMKNLLMWQHPATNNLFQYICLLFIASLWFRGPTLFMFMALGFGVKTFVTGPLYDKFPKVKKRYDGVDRIWSELPTDAELAAREENTIRVEYRTTTCQDTADAATSSTPQSNPSHLWVAFCEKAKIPLSEKLLPSWEEGHRCALMNKEKPLTNMKHGRLYLTQSFLCFERSRSGSSKHLVIKLENITSVSKYKPIHIMPGTGMSIEVEVKGSNKPYIFGALLRRDELFESLMIAGRAANLRWACRGMHH